MTAQASSALDPLIRDFLEWLAKQPRAYADVLDAWRTSCPRLTVWEEAAERGLVERRNESSRGTIIVPTAAGLCFLRNVRTGTLEPDAAP